MAVTITRSVWIDDDGTGTTGTVINQALHTTLYNEIDTALAKVAQLAGGNTFTGNQAITGQLTVSGTGSFGPSLAIRNPLAGATQRSDLLIGNDVSPSLLDVVCYASNYVSTAGYDQPGSTLVYQGGAGLSYYTVGIHRFWTNNLERLRITASGEIVNGAQASVGNSQFCVVADQAVHPVAIGVQNLNAASNVIFFLAFYNSAGATAGYINQTASTTVNYATTSDHRLKDDAGRATDLSALRGVVVHDFRWKADGIRDRGVFAQEAHGLYPRAVLEGTDETTDDGVTLARPWMTDYSKFVPDLIVGWQQHDAEIADLRALLATVKG